MGQNNKHNELPSREPNEMVKKIASASLSIDEIRVMAKIVQALRPEQKMNKVAVIKDYYLSNYSKEAKHKSLVFKCTDLVPEDHKNYKGLYAALKSLRERSVDYKKPKFDGWITYAEHDDKKGVVEIIIGNELIPQYIALGDGYTEYLSKTVFSLNSKYAIHIYKLLSKNKDREYFNLYFSYLREFLGIPEGSYTTVKDFKRRIILPAFEELQEKADIFFEADFKSKVDVAEEGIGVLKNGRNIIGYRVRIINLRPKRTGSTEEKKIEEFITRFMEKTKIPRQDFMAKASLRNWCIKYGTDSVIEKLNGITGYVKNAKKKLDYIQKTLIKEFESK